jgi:hypothetical protein
MADALNKALAALDEAYGPERDLRYEAVRQVLLVLAADLGYKRDTTAHVVGLTLAKGMW